MAWNRDGATVYTLDELRSVNEVAWRSAVLNAWDAYLSAESLEAASALDTLDGYGYCADGCPVGSEDEGFDLLDDCEHR